MYEYVHCQHFLPIVLNLTCSMQKVVALQCNACNRYQLLDRHHTPSDMPCGTGGSGPSSSCPAGRNHVVLPIRSSGTNNDK